MSDGATVPGQWHIEDRLIKQILESHRACLCSCLNPSRFYTFLRSAGVLTKDNQDDIDSEAIMSLKAGRLLDILSSQGYNGFVQLCLAMQEDGTQTELLKTLNEEYQHGYNKLQENMPPQDDYYDDYLPAPGEPGAPGVAPRSVPASSLPSLDIFNQSFLEMDSLGDVSHA